MSEHSIEIILKEWYQDPSIKEDSSYNYDSNKKLLRIFKGPQKNLPEGLVKYKDDITSLSIEETELNNKSLECINLLTELNELFIKAANIQDLNPIKDLQKLKILTLSGMPFNELPDWEEMLKGLESLDISSTHVSKLPSKGLGKIEKLNISMTSITSIMDLPIEILANIKDLNISINNIEELPKTEAKCNNLEILNISQTQIKEIHDCYLPKTLVSLDISQCGVTKLSDTLLNLEKLTFLNVKGLGLEGLPEESTENGELVSKLNKLESLDLSYTKIKRLPKWFSKSNHLNHLKYLGLVGCCLVELNEEEATRIRDCGLDYKDEIGDINNKDQKGVYIKSMVLRDMDVRYLLQNDWDFLKYYYSSKTNLTPAHEVKLVFFGDKGVGKSTIINRIFGIEYATDFFVDQIGLQICMENLKLPVNIKGKKIAPNTRLKIWNMSGEPLYQSAHPVFMTDECLYVVVLDANKEDILYQRALFWLHYIERRTPNSSVFLLLTHTGKKTNDHFFKEILKVSVNEVPRVKLGSMDPVELEESLKVSVSGVNIEDVCLLNIGAQYDYMEESPDIDVLVNSLTETIIKMPVYTKKIPTSWKNIARHTELLIQVRTAVSRKRFNSICEYYGVNDSNVQGNLLVWLGETGLVHRFSKPLKKKDPTDANSSSKKDTNDDNDFIYSILWLTKGIYKSLIVANDKSGMVSISDLHEALNEEGTEDNLFYSKSDIQMLTKEMERCGLAIRNEKKCYFPISNSILVSDDKTRNWLGKIIQNQDIYHYTMELPILTEDMISAIVTRLAIKHMEELSMIKGSANPWDSIAWGREGIGLSYPESGDSLMVVGIPGCPSTLHIYASPPKRVEINNNHKFDQSTKPTQPDEYAKSAFRAFYEAFDRSGYRELPIFELYIELFQGNAKANIPLDDISGYIDARRKEYYCAKLQRTYDIDYLQKFLLYGKNIKNATL